jgi:hypothetical protein
MMIIIFCNRLLHSSKTAVPHLNRPLKVGSSSRIRLSRIVTLCSRVLYNSLIKLERLSGVIIMILIFCNRVLYSSKTLVLHLNRPLKLGSSSRIRLFFNSHVLLINHYAVMMSSSHLSDPGSGCPGGVGTGGECSNNSNSSQKNSGRDIDMPQVGSASTSFFSQNYYQCRAGRDATFKNDAVESSHGAELGYIVGGEDARLGSFEDNLDTIQDCFVGSRVYRESTQVNQNLCCTFDPATLTCLNCSSQHTVISNAPVCFCVSDQNFVANLAGTEGTNGCVGVIRLESAGLCELADITTEILKQAKLYPGSVICMGSGTHLHRVGATRYACDWNIAAARLSKTFPNVRICPLIPIPTANCPGALALNITYLACWYARMYTGSTLGLPDCWAKLTRFTAELSAADVEAPTYHTIAMPASLSPDAQLTTYRFRTTHSRHVSTSGLDVKATDELVLALLNALQSQLGIDCSPRDTPVRTTAREGRGKENITKLILIGASNMRRCIPPLRAQGFEVVDLTHIEWKGSDDSVKKVLEAVEQYESGHTEVAVILDLLTCISYRFVQDDGGLALPMKISGRYHLLGDLDCCTDAVLKNCIGKFFPIFRKLEGYGLPMVICPPLPRYLAGGCCPIESHAANAQLPNHGENFLQKIMHLRKVVRGELDGSGLRAFWIPDPVQGLTSALNQSGNNSGPENMARISSPSVACMAAEIGMLMLGDNVHYTQLGYTNLALELSNSLKKCLNKLNTAAECNVSGTSSESRGKQPSYFWRGFLSQRGAIRPRFSATNFKTGSGKRAATCTHPYRGRGSRR